MNLALNLSYKQLWFLQCGEMLWNHTLKPALKTWGIFTSDTHSVSHSDCSCTPVKDYNSEQQVFQCLCLHCAVLGVEQPGDDAVMRRARREELPPLSGEWPAVAFTTRINGHGHKRKLFFALQQQRNVCHYWASIWCLHQPTLERSSERSELWQHPGIQSQCARLFQDTPPSEAPFSQLPSIQNVMQHNNKSFNMDDIYLPQYF